MKKITLLISALIISVSMFAATGWFNDYIFLDVNGVGTTPAPTGWYWIGADPSYATVLDGTDLGVVTTLSLKGCDMKYWSDHQDRTGGSFFYKIMSTDNTTELVAPVETVWDQTKLAEINDYQGTKTVDINLLDQTKLQLNTTYKLHVWAKSWGTSQGDSWLSNSNNNYVLTFTTPVSWIGTNTDKMESSVKLSAVNGKISAQFEGEANIQLYSVSGQLLTSKIVSSQFVQDVAKGVYILSINGKAHKVLVR